MAVELELSGYGPAAWRLSPAQLVARVQKMWRMRQAREVEFFGAYAVAQCGKEDLVREYLAARQ